MIYKQKIIWYIANWIVVVRDKYLFQASQFLNQEVLPLKGLLKAWNSDSEMNAL